MKITYEYTSDREQSRNYIVRATLANNDLSATLEAPGNPDGQSHVTVQKVGTNGHGSKSWAQTQHKSVPFKVVNFAHNGDGQRNETDFLYNPPGRVNVPDAIPDPMVQEAARFLEENKGALRQMDRVLRTHPLIEAVPTHIEAGGGNIPVEKVPYARKSPVRGA